MIISLIQHFEADFLWKVSLKILNSGLILKTFTHVAIRGPGLGVAHLWRLECKSTSYVRGAGRTGHRNLAHRGQEKVGVYSYS